MNQHLESLKEKTKTFPLDSGVYLMKNRTGKIIYIGKAKNLKNRVRSYFTNSKDHSAKTLFLVKNLSSIDYVITKTEVEAFLLEASLIKKHRPRYNIQLKDDKSYPYIRFSLSHEFPRLYISRKVKNDGSLYFGPYTTGYGVRGVIKFLNRVFKIRDCTDGVFKSRQRPCLTYEIGRCMAPCVDMISLSNYTKDIKGAVAFLKGDSDKVIKELTRQMQAASSQQRYELAASYRDSIKSVETILEKQSVIEDSDKADRDVMGFFSSGSEQGTLIASVHVRAGRISAVRFQHLLHLNGNDEDHRDWLVSFINQYYEDNVIPKEVLLPVDIGEDLTRLLEKVLFERRGQEVKVRFPTFGIGQDLLQMANKNAQSHYFDYINKVEEKKKALEFIQKRLRLQQLPFRIECFDISHFQGDQTVGSQVVFEEGLPSKDNYRRYRLKTVDGVDDYKSMKEVLTRRFKHTEYDEPQLIVIDGGKGQLGVAVKVLKQIGKEHIPVIALAKARVEGDFTKTHVTSSEERFFLSGRQNPVVFAPGSGAFQILVGIRDEAHRFAITYHRKLREKVSLQSCLDQIVGLGPKRIKILLQNFSSVVQIQEASFEDLESLPSFNQKIAQKILDFFSQKNQEGSK